MSSITVYTKQDQRVLDILEQTGRHTAKAKFVMQNDDSRLMCYAYNWLMQHHPDAKNRPVDADYPVWVSYRHDATMLNSPGYVILELSIDPARITRINIAKWGAINNCSYIPANPEDGIRHRKKMDALGVNDVKACTTQFYPELKREIEDSWMRLFDDNIQLGNNLTYGLIWEVQKEWITRVIR